MLYSDTVRSQWPNPGTAAASLCPPEVLDAFSPCDVFFITLKKSERLFSPTTRYKDAISAWEFHWESQSNSRQVSSTGQRYIHHRERGSRGDAAVSLPGVCR